MWKKLCALVVLLQTGIETLCATWFSFKCAPFVKKRQKKLKLFKAVVDKTCKRQRARPCCCLKLAPNHTAQLSFCFKLARIVTKVKFVRNSVRNSFFARNCRQNTLRNFCFAWKVKLQERNRSHFSCCSKLASKHSAQLSFRLQLASLIKQPDKIFSLFDL